MRLNFVTVDAELDLQLSSFEDERDFDKMLKIKRSDLTKVQETSEFPTLTKLRLKVYSQQLVFVLIQNEKLFNF